MIALRDHGTYKNLQIAKKLITLDQKDHCLSDTNETIKKCRYQATGDKTITNFVTLSDGLTITVDELNLVDDETYKPRQKLANVCKMSKAVSDSAKHLCKNAKKKLKRSQDRRDNYDKYHVFYNKKKRKFIKEEKDTGGTILAGAVVQNIMPMLGNYLYAENLKYENNSLYNKAITQKNMNYLSDQQFDWYMKNYALYGADPYALSGGYDPFYASTFQFGNPDFTAYSGYYSY
jgi:hypothetical protein